MTNKERQEFLKYLRAKCFEIRNLKKAVSHFKNTDAYEDYTYYSDLLDKERREYTHYHIAYSQLRGRSREEIINNSQRRFNNSWITRIMNKYRKSEEDKCTA